MTTPDIVGADVVLGCDDLDATLAFFRDELDFRLDAIRPADNPRQARISGHGLAIVLDTDTGLSPGSLRLRVHADSAPRIIEAPNGTRIECVPDDAPPVVPSNVPAFHVAHADSSYAWITGRAGMQYRDLLPLRHGGRFIASHIRIPGAGPVPDSVHHHHVRFQLIVCRRGSVQVVYEDQGEPFWLHSGDAVLQPPHIRHRVLASADDLEVLEIGCPAEHDTLIDHALELPTPELRPDRDFGGQRFVHHVAADTPWTPSEYAGCEMRVMGLAAATDDLAEAHTIRASEETSLEAASHDAELLFGFVLEGRLTLTCGNRSPEPLTPDTAFAIPKGEPWTLQATANTVWLEVRV